MWTTLKIALRALHEDQKGADMVEYVLIVAAVALPLLGVIVFFWDDIKEWVFEKTDELKEDVDNASNVP